MHKIKFRKEKTSIPVIFIGKFSIHRLAKKYIYYDVGE